MFAVEGLLNAGKLRLNLHGSSRAHEIGGEKITVKKMGRFGLRGLKNFIWPHGRDKGLNVDVIEGDDVYLENTGAKVVRGNNVELGLAVKLNWWNIRTVLNRMKNLRSLIIRKYNYI